MPVSRSKLGTLLLALTLAPAATQLAAAAELLDVRQGRHPDFIRVVIDLSDTATYRLLEADNGRRRILEIDAQMADGLDCCAKAPPGTPLQGLVLQSGAQGSVQLQLSLDAPHRSLDVFDLSPDPATGRGHRIVIDVSAKALSEPAGEQIASGPADSPSPSSLSDDAAISAPSSQDSSVAAAQVAVEADAADVADKAPRARYSRTSSAGTAFATGEPARRVDFSGVWRHAYAWNSSRGESQKFESFLEPRWDARWSDRLALTAIMRVRLDGIGDLGPAARKAPNYSDLSAPWFNSAEAELSLREFYLDFNLGNAALRVGKQQIVWGQADGFKVLDVVNPQSFREYLLDDFDNSRIPLWSVNAEVPIGELGSLQLIWIPDTTYHELAEPGTPYALTTPRFLPQLPITSLAEPDKPDDPLTDGDAGAAFTAFWGGWDLSLNYLYRYLDAPVLSVVAGDGPGFRLVPEYARSHLLGGTFSNAFGAVTLRGELGYNSHGYYASNSPQNRGVFEAPEFSGVLGVDWVPQSSQLISLQWFVSYLTDYAKEVNRDRNEQLLSALYQTEFGGSTWRLRGIALHSLNDRDTQLQLRLSYWLLSELELHAGVDAFFGSEQGLFGQFDEEDRLVLGFEYSF